MSQQSSSSTRKESFRGSLSFGQPDSSNSTFSPRGPWGQSLEVHHGHRTTPHHFEGSMQSNLEPHGVGFLHGTGNSLPMAHGAASLSPGGTDGVYLYEAFFDAFSQYASSQASPHNVGDSQHLGRWNQALPNGTETSMSGNLVSVTQFGINAPEDPALGDFDAVMAGFGPNLVPWDHGMPTSPSQNSSATGSLSVSMAMDYSRRNSMSYSFPSIVSGPIERSQFDAHVNPVAAAASTPGVKGVVGNKRKPSVKGTKGKARKTSTAIVETPNPSEHPTPSTRSNLSTAATADAEPFAPGHEASETSSLNGKHTPRPRDSVSHTYQALPGSQRQRNRQAATKCREKTKAATAQLEATEKAITLEHMELSRTVAELRGEVLALKNELLLHGNCDCEVIQQYLNNAARNIGAAGSVNHTSGQNSAATWTAASQPASRKPLS